jgi:hypothetical protein
MKLLSTGSYSPYFENRKLVRGCTPEVIPFLLTESQSVVGNQILWARCWNRKLFRSWKPDIENRKLFLTWKPHIVNRKLKTVYNFHNIRFTTTDNNFRFTNSVFNFRFTICGFQVRNNFRFSISGFQLRNNFRFQHLAHNIWFPTTDWLSVNKNGITSGVQPRTTFRFGKILIIFVYFQGLVVMLNLGSRNVWINGRCCVLV